MKRINKFPAAAVASGVAGAAIIGSALAVTLQNKKTRKMLTETLSDFKEKSTVAYQDLQERAKEYGAQHLEAAKGGRSTRKKVTKARTNRTRLSRTKKK